MAVPAIAVNSRPSRRKHPGAATAKATATAAGRKSLFIGPPLERVDPRARGWFTVEMNRKHSGPPCYPPCSWTVAGSGGEMDGGTAERAIVRRCWPAVDASQLMLDYHDREWGVPLHGDRELFA